MTSTTAQAFDALEARLGYRFKDRGLLEHALTHKSKAHEDPSGGVADIGDIEALKRNAHLGIEGVICGRAIYDGRLALADALRLAA